MRNLLSTRRLPGLVAASLLCSSALAPIARAESCLRPVEHVAFDVAGLKSELMVVAIACQMQDRYNDFITRFRSELVQDERTLTRYFYRTAGHHAQQEHDTYITNLANSESQDGITQGNLFCGQHAAMFSDVLALKDSKDLSGYAESKTLAQPIALQDCPARPAPVRKRKLRTASEK